MEQTLEQVEEMIFEFFENKNVETIVLAGKAGIGKTWMARKVSLRAVRENLFDITLWVYLSSSHDERILYQNIAHQLSLLSNSKELEIDDNDVMEESVDEDVEDLEKMKNKIRGKLSDKRLILILDDERNSIHEEETQKLCSFLKKNLQKVLVTSVNEDCGHVSTETKKVIDMKPLGREKLLPLLQKRVGAEVFEIPGVDTLVAGFMDRNTGMTPTEVGMIAKLLSYHQNDFGIQGLERVLEEVKDNISCNYLHLLWSKYDKVPCDILVDISWQGSHMFRDYAAMHYSGLISYWIMEGYLDHINHIDKAFEEGHRILMELMDCGVLKKVDADHLIMQKVSLNLDNSHRRGFCGTANLGLANVFVDGCNWEGVGKVTPADGIITSLGSDSKDRKPSTLLLDGNCLQMEELAHYLDSNQELKTLGLFHPRLKELSLSNNGNLSVLLLRNCEFMENIDCIRELSTLNVLEVSGASSLESIPAEFFSKLKQIQSLNLSFLQIAELPKSVGDLTELRWLIVKGCSMLTKAPNLQKCKKLVVVDLCGATKLESFPVKNLKSLPKLQRLDLSGTNIKSLPILRETVGLTHLSLSGCENMDRLPSIKTLRKLQVLDLARATIKEFHDSSFQSNTSLKILDLSESDIQSLPSNIGTPCQVLLKACNNLKSFSCVNSPRNLELLDLSGASYLTSIEAKFFDHLENLRLLNLSNTKVSVLPVLSGLLNLRQLLLSSCSNLQRLPSLNSLCKLEVLDLSGCKSLTMIEDDSLEHLSRLQRLSLSDTKVERIPALKSLSNIEELNLRGVQSLAQAEFLKDMSDLHTLDLSETLLEQLPPLSTLKKLSNLCLSGCLRLKNIPNLGELTKLEILDLSGTAVRKLSSLKNLSNLRKLQLKNCWSLEGFEDIKIGDIFGSTTANLPYGISELKQLEHLDLPNVRNNEGSDGEKIQCLHEKLNECHWSISRLAGTVSNVDRSFISSSCSEFLKLLEKDPSIWETSFKDFQLSIHPLEKQNETGGIFYNRGEFSLLSRHFSHLKGQGRFLEINGFSTFPLGIENVLRHADYMYLFNNSFLKSLADLSASDIKMMKGCWMHRCQNLEHVVGEEEGLKGKELEILWVSNASSLMTLYHPNLQHEPFQKLKCLYLDCCPNLSSIFSSSHWPQALEVLQIKFCDTLAAVVEDDAQRPTLQKLHTLLLWELPALKSIRCVMPSLQFLEVGGCPMLGHILSLEHIPEKLKVLKVRNCEKLETLFQGTTRENVKLPDLCTIQLWELPELKSVGIDLPSQLELSVKECPNLQIPPLS